MLRGSPVGLFIQLTENMGLSVAAAFNGSRMGKALQDVYLLPPADGSCTTVTERMCFLVQDAAMARFGTFWLERSSKPDNSELIYLFGHGGKDIPQRLPQPSGAEHRIELLEFRLSGNPQQVTLADKTGQLGLDRISRPQRLALLDKVMGSPRLLPQQQIVATALN